MGADDHLDDRSHRVLLGGAVEVPAMWWDDVRHELPVAVRTPLETRVRVPVRVFVMRDCGLLEVDGSVGPGLLRLIEVMREAYAQVGVEITLPHQPVVVPVPAALQNGSSVKAHLPGSQDPSPEGQIMLRACGVDDTQDDYTIVFCKKVDGADNGDLWGYAYPKGTASDNWSGSAIVSGDNGFVGVLVAAHELGHLLTRLAHFGVNYPNPQQPQHWIDHNLMKSESSYLQGIPKPCRLTKLQQDVILKNLGINDP